MQGSRTHAALPKRVGCERLSPLAETLAMDEERQGRKLPSLAGEPTASWDKTPCTGRFDAVSKSLGDVRPL